ESERDEGPSVHEPPPENGFRRRVTVRPPVGNGDVGRRIVAPLARGGKTHSTCDRRSQRRLCSLALAPDRHAARKRAGSSWSNVAACRCLLPPDSACTRSSPCSEQGGWVRSI